MVTVNNYNIRQNSEGKTFITLELTGDIEMVQSAKTGRFYATNRKCNIPCTFDEATAKNMLGKQMPGTIAKMQCDPYDYTLPETGETIQLEHSYGYVPEQRSLPQPTLQTVQL